MVIHRKVRMFKVKENRLSFLTYFLFIHCVFHSMHLDLIHFPVPLYLIPAHATEKKKKEKNVKRKNLVETVL